jgi:hypothetical protein
LRRLRQLRQLGVFPNSKLPHSIIQTRTRAIVYIPYKSGSRGEKIVLIYNVFYTNPLEVNFSGAETR